MIPENFITEWKEYAPWSDDQMVEQDLIISRVLVELYRHPYIAKTLAFRGGTALNKLFIFPPVRYSQDIDLVQISAGPIGDILSVIKQILNPILGKPQWVLNQGRATLFYKYQPENTLSGIKAKVKIEINTREHFTIFGLHTIPHKVNNRWFSGSALINTYTLEELMGTKLRALYQRKKGRDLFDLWVVLEQKKIDVAKIIVAFQKYLAFDNKSVTRAMFEKNLAEKLQSPVFTNDISILLAPDIIWDLALANDKVHQHIIALLPGDVWKGNPG